MTYIAVNPLFCDVHKRRMLPCKKCKKLEVVRSEVVINGVLVEVNEVK